MSTVLEAEEKRSQADPVQQTVRLAGPSKEAARPRPDPEDSKIVAAHLTKRARYAAEDLLEDVTHSIKHYPLFALAIAFGVGATLGTILVGSLKAGKS